MPRPTASGSGSAVVCGTAAAAARLPLSTDRRLDLKRIPLTGLDMKPALGAVAAAAVLLASIVAVLVAIIFLLR